MDVPRPIPNQKLRADWGRAVVDALAAGRVDGPGVLRTPGGTSLPPARPPDPPRHDPPEAPFSCVLAADGDGGLVVRVRPGAVRDESGEPLEYVATDFADAGDWWEAAAPEGEAEVAAEALGEGWTLRLGGNEGEAPAWRVPLAAADASEGRRAVRQLRRGDILLPAHFGDAEDAEEAEAWSLADARPAILRIDMPGAGEDDPPRSVKVLVDSRGNVVGWNAGEDPEDPEAPEKPSAPPPCGHPLNEAPDDYHPLSGGGGGGAASGEDEEDDDHPLDHEGPGGFTPACGDP